MAYDVIVSPTAMKDAEEYAALIRERSNDDVAANAWWDGLLDALLSLELLPGRCPGVPESFRGSSELHYLLYGSHRIVFRIEQQSVRVPRIYHTARRPLKKKDVSGA